MVRRLAVVLGVLIGLAVPAAGSAKPLRVQWIRGVSSVGTPSRYDRVGLLKIGSPRARNVLVLVPGTSAGAAYFVPLAQWIARTLPNWQVWSIERRENLFEDQSSSDRTKLGRESATDNFNYYLGYLGNRSITRHFKPLGDVSFAKRWGMAVSVGDLHNVIAAAKRLRGRVVLGGHSLGGSVVTAYATWDFGHGRPGAADLAGLVYIDGSSFRAPESAAAARAALGSLAAASTPWLTFGNIPAPLAGLFENTGALAALKDPNTASAGQTSGLLPKALVPPVRVTNLAQYGFAQNVGTSPTSLIAAQAHLGRGVAARATNGVHGWDSTGALTPITRFATMFGAPDILGADGVEWYFPQRLTDDTAAVGNGLANPAQRVLGVRSTLGRKLPRALRMYAFGARLGGAAVLEATRNLARQSGIPASQLTLVNRQSTYAHNDPAGAYPRNVFFSGLVPFLKRVAATG